MGEGGKGWKRDDADEVNERELVVVEDGSLTES